jgi:hypothetical protein
MNHNTSQVKRVLWMGGGGCLLLIFLHLLIYFLQPFETAVSASTTSTWDDFIINMVTILAAIFSSVCATLILFQYERDERPRSIWVYVATGFWLWTVAEIIWMVFNIAQTVVPLITSADIFWIAGYLVLTGGLASQYHLLYRPSRRNLILRVAGFWAVVLASTILITWLVNPGRSPFSDIGIMLSIFYSVSDLVLGIVALLFILAFRGGAMMRPWLGIFILAIADCLYVWLYESGIYAFTAATGNIPSLIADAMYNIAYMVLGFGFLLHFLLVKFGPSAFRNLGRTESPSIQPILEK